MPFITDRDLQEATCPATRSAHPLPLYQKPPFHEDSLEKSTPGPVRATPSCSPPRTPAETCRDQRPPGHLELLLTKGQALSPPALSDGGQRKTAIS